MSPSGSSREAFTGVGAGVGEKDDFTVRCMSNLSGRRGGWDRAIVMSYAPWRAPWGDSIAIAIDRFAWPVEAGIPITFPWRMSPSWSMVRVEGRQEKEPVDAEGRVGLSPERIQIEVPLRRMSTVVDPDPLPAVPA